MLLPQRKSGNIPRRERRMGIQWYTQNLDYKLIVHGKCLTIGDLRVKAPKGLVCIDFDPCYVVCIDANILHFFHLRLWIHGAK